MVDAQIADLITEFYDQLNGFARYLLRKERPGHEMDSNDLLHDCYLALVANPPPPEKFLAVAKQRMRWRLIDFARTNQGQRRGYTAISKRREHWDYESPLEGAAYKIEFFRGQSEKDQSSKVLSPEDLSTEEFSNEEASDEAPYYSEPSYEQTVFNALSYEQNFDFTISANRALAALKPEDAQILDLRLAGLRTGEIAAFLGLPASKVRQSRSAPAMQSLAAALEPYLGLSSSRYRRYPWPDPPWPRPEPNWPIPSPNDWTYAAEGFRRLLGTSSPWAEVLLGIQGQIIRRPDRAFYLSDIDHLARVLRCEPDQILIALTSLTRPPFSILTMELRAGSEQGPKVRTEEMIARMKGWHRAKTVSDQAWHEWTSSVWVIWTGKEFPRGAQ